MKTFILIYQLFALIYGLIFASLLVMDIVLGQWDKAISSLFWGIVSITYGLLIAKLLKNISTSKASKRRFFLANFQTKGKRK